jgi:hypothetical protein
VKILDGIKHQGNPFCIPDCMRRQLPYFFIEMGYKTGVEVGVHLGHFMRWFCRRGFKMYGVDPWSSYPGYKRSGLEYIYNHAKEITAPYDCTLIRKTSMEAVKDFEDESVDFVFIDGNHLYEYVSMDINEWSKKVRKGGVVSGHDYDQEGVKTAVHSYIKLNDIDNWWVLGREEIVPGEVREVSRTWMWIK